MYPIFLAVHNILRWVALILGILAAVMAWRGWLRQLPWNDANRRFGVFFASALDSQLLVGLLLYFVFSPLTRAALGNFGAAMSEPAMRFFAVEHALFMLLAVVFGHLGGALARKQEGAARHRTAALWYTLAVLLIIVGIPWGRPLFPGF